ncbi:MAG TPA: LAGLIDADG family homing endonuclease, partial [Actinomadura sp.]|nr:LAGLIDADG family homing endonuclease [Actinomadura sp.]
MTLETRKPTGAIPWPLILIEGGEKAGKAQPLHARIATPTGWTTMSELAVGDQVIGSDGHATTVTAVHERGLRPIYRLTFSDGATVEACDEHLWATWTSSGLHRTYNKGPKKGQRNPRPATIRTTAELREMVLDGTVLHIPMASPVEYATSGPLPLDPYLLGLLLGDGGLTKANWPTFTSGDPELFDALGALLPAGDVLTRHDSRVSAGIKGGRTTAALRDLGLMGARSVDKFIPAQYMTAAVADRLALLQGLMDTDGGMERKSITFTSVSARLAEQTQELVRSLGGSCSMLTKQPSYRNPAGERVVCKTAYRLTMRLPTGMCPFRLGRKVQRWQESRPTFNTPPRRTIRAVDFVGEMPARCITVASDDHLYLTDHFVVTHNSWACAVLSTSDKVGRTYWLDLGEGSGDEYGAIPGTRYEVVVHDGTFASICSAVEDIHALAQKAQDVGDKPVVLIIDTMTAEWE